MKELKALEILRHKEENLRYGVESGFSIYANELIEVQEAILELEALQAPKTCDGCKHYIDDNENIHNKRWVECTLLYAETRSFFNIDTFSCIFYEPKDQK